MNNSKHDLVSPEIQEEWINRVESGEFDALMLSPPCATWSRARSGRGPSNTNHTQ